MKHQLKIIIFCELDTEHPGYDGPQDIDQIRERLEDVMHATKPEDGDGHTIRGVHVEVVE